MEAYGKKSRDCNALWVAGVPSALVSLQEWQWSLAKRAWDQMKAGRKYIAFAMNRLNHRPRKYLGFKTPHEVFMKQLQSHQQAVTLRV